MKIFITFILSAVFLFSSDFDIETLRKQQQVELEQNVIKFREVSKKHISEGGYDSTAKEGLLKEYSKSRNKIIDKYKKIDTYRTNELKADLKLNGGLTNTGSFPRNANADVDIVANNEKAFEQQKKAWIKKYGKENINIEGYKVTNKKTDTVMWKSEGMLTSAERKKISKDHDAYITSGGKHSTSVRSSKIKSSSTGSGLDPLRKLTYGSKHNIIKDVGKSLVKITTQADGKEIIGHIESGTLLEHKTSNKRQLEENMLLKQASDLKNYKDPIEAGIVDLSDSPTEARRKEKQFEKKSLELAVKKQKKLDLIDQRKKRIYKYMIDTFPEGSSKKVELQEKLVLSEQSNKDARKQVNQALKDLGSDKQLLSREKIKEIEHKEYAKREQNRDVEKEKLLKQANMRKSKRVKKRVRVSGMGVAAFLTTSYQLKESFNDTISAGGNSFVTINKNDNQVLKNVKAVIGLGLESTTFGGAYSAGKRADEEEKQRIISAIKKGETINPFVSFARASFFGFAYVVKDATLGSLEYTKNKLIEMDKEIKGNIKSYVDEKYAKLRVQEQSEKIVKYKKIKKEKTNEKWDKFLDKNRKSLEDGQKKVVNDLDKKVTKERSKARKIKVAKDEFSSSFIAGEKSIKEYSNRLVYIEKTKKEILRIKKETEQTQKRIDEQWDFMEGAAVFAGAVNDGAKEYQKSSSQYSSKNGSSGNSGVGDWSKGEIGIQGISQENKKQSKSKADPKNIENSTPCVTSRCWKETTLNGDKLRYQYIMRNGNEVRDGQFTRYRQKSGALYKKGFYKNDCKVGTWTHYHITYQTKAPFKDVIIFENCKEKSYKRVQGH